MRIEGSLPGRATILAERSDTVPSRGLAPTNATRTSSHAEPAEPVLPPVKVAVSMIERLTGRPVRLIDASELNSLKLDKPPPERPAPLSSRPDWGVSLGVMDRGGTDSSSDASTISARATLLAPDGSRTDLTVTIALSSEFVADQRARVREGRSPLADPLLISVGAALPGIRDGATSLGLGLDSSGGAATMSIAPELTRSNLAAEASLERTATARALDPATMKHAAALSAGSVVANRPLVAAPAWGSFLRAEDERDEAIRLDVAF